MTSVKIHRNSEWRLDEQLKRLFIKDSFKQAISGYRKGIGMPAGGFGSNEEYHNWITKNENKFFDIQSARAKLCRQFGFPLNSSLWVEAYLLIGDGFKQFNTKIPLGISFSRGFEKSGFGCALEKDLDYQCVNIKVFPGTSYREIKKFIQENMAEIKNFLDTFDKRVRPIRKKRQLERDSHVYECYKNGWLNRYGSITNTGDDLIPDFIRKMDMDMRRKIIGEQIKMRK